MIIDLIEVLNKEEDPDPEPDPDQKEIILDPDLRGPKCNAHSLLRVQNNTAPFRIEISFFLVVRFG